jgi:hypothetical protein
MAQQDESTAIQATRMATTLGLLARVFASLIVGAATAIGVYGLTKLVGIWQYVIFGALIGCTIGVLWEVVGRFWLRFHSQEWQITEIEMEFVGQKWKFANSGSQRRVAWLLFVEATTRVATQSMAQDEGDDSIALRSLYDFFQSTRKAIGETGPTKLLPSGQNNLETVESFALAMLNQDLRPFLSKWHPSWDKWRSKNTDCSSGDWPFHKEFRKELAMLQSKVRERAKGFAKIAGVSDVERLL